MDNMLPKSTLVEVGDTVYLKDSMPVSREYKVVAVLLSTQLPYKDFVWVEDKETKERTCVLAEWLSHEAFTEQWREESKPAETSYRAIEDIDTKKELEVKDKQTLSSEITEGKLPNEILASHLEPLSEDEDELLRFNLANRMTSETGEEDDVVEEFLGNATIGKAIDGTYWGFFGSRKIAVLVDEDFNVDQITYFVKSSAIRPQDFFGLEKTGGITIMAYKEDEYVLNLGGDEYYMTGDDLNDFCNDWELDYSQVRSSLTKTGKWSLGN